MVKPNCLVFCSCSGQNVIEALCDFSHSWGDRTSCCVLSYFWPGLPAHFVIKHRFNHNPEVHSAECLIVLSDWVIASMTQRCSELGQLFGLLLPRNGALNTAAYSLLQKIIKIDFVMSIFSNPSQVRKGFCLKALGGRSCLLISRHAPTPLSPG